MQPHNATDIVSLFQGQGHADTANKNVVGTETVPYNIEAEQALLGALILNNGTFEHISDFLRADHFSQKVHGVIFSAIAHSLERGRIADPITLKDVLNNDAEFLELGGYQYLVDLSDSVYSLVSVADYGRLIYDMYMRRQLIAIGHETIVDARMLDGERVATNVIEDAERRLYNLATIGNSGQGAVSFGHALAQAITTAEGAFKRDSHVVGVTSGFTDMDKWLGGLHPSDLLILAGRPSMGKTALATNIAFNAAKGFIENNKDGAPVLFFSLEMSSEQLANRILSSESGVSSDLIRRGAIRADDFPKLVDVSRRLGEVPLFIDDTPALTVTAVRNRARRLQRQHGIGMIVIDYLQLLSGSSKSSDGNRVQEISEITRSLKALAKELNVPVLALSQLSRAVEQRDDKRPQLSDLRESGSIEQDSDVVMFVYREEYYEGRKEPTPGTDKHIEWQTNMSKVHNKAEVIIAKQRHGPIGTVRLYFDGSVTKFGNLAKEDQSDPHGF
ncbi:MAG: replicative DNA helicase [Alphaproteobacteria bacterium]|nr:replicative DNA helicase [Alphaproteobacteria bacterium]